MSKLLLLTCATAVLCLSACNKPGVQGAQNGQMMNGQTTNGQNPQQLAQADPYAQQPPAPYYPSDPNAQQPATWPGAAPMPQNPGAQPMQPVAPGYMPGGGAPLAINGAPQGMTVVRSQAGHVYRASLTGSQPVPQQSRDVYMKLIPFFDAQPQVMGYLDEPSGRMSQVGFQATKGGAPVMGMLVVSQTQGGVTAVVMLESPDRFQQSLQAMSAAAQQP